MVTMIGGCAVCDCEVCGLWEARDLVCRVLVWIPCTWKGIWHRVPVSPCSPRVRDKYTFMRQMWVWLVVVTYVVLIGLFLF